MNFPNVFKNVLSAKQDTITSLSEKLGISKSAVSDYANGKRSPSATVIAKLKEVYPDLNSDWLLSGEGEMVKKQDVPNVEHLQSELSEVKKKLTDLEDYLKKFPK